MNEARRLKLFFIVCLCTAFIFSFQFFSQKAMFTLFDTNQGYKEGTTIGSVDISGQVKEQAILALQNKTEEWLEKKQVVLQYNTVSFPADSFSFDIEESVKEVRDGAYSPVKVRISEDRLLSQIEKNTNSEIISLLDTEKLKQKLQETASRLSSEPQTLQLTDFMNKEEAAQVLSQSSITGVSAYMQGLSEWVKHNETLTVPAQGEVSVLELAKKKHLGVTDDTLSIIGSLMYKAVLSTNFIIAEREIGRELPEYIKMGMEAKVIQNKQDFRFVNSNQFSYTLKFQLLHDGISLYIEGYPFLYDYSIDTKTALLPAGTIVQKEVPGKKDDAVLTPRNGRTGQVMKVYRIASNENGDVVKREKLAEDYYLPINAVETKIAEQVTQQTVPETSASSETQTEQSSSAGTETNPSAENEQQTATEDVQTSTATE